MVKLSNHRRYRWPELLKPTKCDSPENYRSSGLPAGFVAQVANLLAFARDGIRRGWTVATKAVRHRSRAALAILTPTLLAQPRVPLLGVARASTLPNVDRRGGSSQQT